MIPAGVFIIRKGGDESAEVLLDYVTKEYRDFRVGKFIYERCREYFTHSHIYRLYVKDPVPSVQKYLCSMGYAIEDAVFSLKLNSGDNV